MSNGNGKSASASPVATNDFVKSNGLDRKFHEVMPGGPSMTRQEFADECDINKLMSRYDGFLADPAKSVLPPRYVDFSDMPQDLMGFMKTLKDGEEAFMRLPAKVRREFDNDAVAFVDFAMNPENLDQLIEWELAPKKPPASPEASSQAPAAPPAAGAGAPSAQAPGAPPAPPAGAPNTRAT